jgi:hypothetical protein
LKKILIPLGLLLAITMILGRINVKEVETSIVIDAPIERIWQVLIEGDAYPNWNPLIRKISDDIYEGNKIKVTLDPQFSSEGEIEIKVGQLWFGEVMVWIGRPLMSNLLSGRHYFKTKEMDDGKIQFINMETYSGLALYLTWPFIEPKARQGFEAMNSALKAEVERL